MVEHLKFNQKVERHISFDYLCYTPKDYDGTKKYPLLLFLHGAGERGNDVSLVGRYGFFKQAAEGKDFPFIMVGPQCPSDQYWGNHLESLNIFLDEIIAQYNVDESRIYLNGISMGGTGTWHLLMAHPERFAAAAPVCGTGIYWYGIRIANKPLGIFHGDADTTVPIADSYAMVESIRRYGGDPKLTVFEGVGHNAWDYAYTNELVDWFLKHSL